MSEYFELYSNQLYIDITESKSLTSSIVIPSIFVNGAQYLNATWVAAWPIIVASHLTKM